MTLYYDRNALIMNTTDQSVTTIRNAFPQQAMPVNTEFLADNGYGFIKLDASYLINTQTQMLQPSTPVWDETTQEFVTKEIVPIPDASILMAAKGKTLTTLQSNFNNKITAGFTYTDGNVYDIDDVAQVNITSVQAAFLVGIPGAHGGYWRSYNNINVPMTDSQVQNFFKAVYAYKLGLIQRTQNLTDSIVAAADLATLNSIDISLT
jgi:hypothetical protein